MSRGGNPLIEGFFETVIAVRNIFRRPPRFRRRDPRTESAEHIVVERIFRGHGLGLLQCNPDQGGVHGDTPFAVLQAKLGNHRGGRGFCGGPAANKQGQGEKNREVSFHLLSIAL